jgi:hypothetical protein
MAHVDVVLDLLDRQLVDRDGRPLGKVDGVGMTWRRGEPPRITHVEIGAATLARRLPRPFDRALDWLARRLGPRGGEPYRIPVSRILHIETDVALDLDARRTPALAIETWVRDHVIARIPGA